ncbi:hypothetical protein L9F63_001284 [Diploptera punctata]|uniref:lysozyme n=1 Tax=Diploptera punctata TaxID=6984 RepID=A0AAD8EJ53_DIPPU|nr:hypothetical protein L9F63_001284 [Diploptera punctata]
MAIDQKEENRETKDNTEGKHEHSNASKRLSIEDAQDRRLWRLFTKMKSIFCIIAGLAAISYTNARIYDAESLTSDLRNFGVPEDQIPTFVCIAQHESSFNTGIVGNPNSDNSQDYGLFQINNHFWCQNGSPGNGCNISCEDLLNDDISDDVACARQILQQQGFGAWTTYQYCH